MDFERKRRSVHEINLTPLIDIVFHLMVFVMLTTTFVVSESMELSLPSGKGKPSAGAEKAMRIQIASTGDVQVDDKPMTMDGLSTALAEKLGDDADTHIAVFTTPGVNVQQLVNVLDTVYLTGGRNVQVDKAGS